MLDTLISLLQRWISLALFRPAIPFCVHLLMYILLIATWSIGWERCFSGGNDLEVVGLILAMTFLLCPCKSTSNLVCADSLRAAEMCCTSGLGSFKVVSGIVRFDAFSVIGSNLTRDRFLNHAAV